MRDEGRSQEIVAVLVATSVTEEGISIISSSSSGFHSPPRNISSSSRRSISGSRRGINSSSSSSDRLDTLLAGGDHRVFVSISASPDISIQSVERYLPRR